MECVPWLLSWQWCVQRGGKPSTEKPKANIQLSVESSEMEGLLRMHITNDNKTLKNGNSYNLQGDDYDPLI